MHPLMLLLCVLLLAASAFFTVLFVIGLAGHARDNIRQAREYEQQRFQRP